MTDKQNYFTYTDNTSNDKDKIMENLHKQIITDGVDVSGCDFLAKEDDYCSYSGETRAYKGQCGCSDEEMCKDHPNCFYKKALKQLDQLKAVNEELKSENDKFKDMAKKGLDEYKDVGGCWGCGIQLSLDQVLLDYRKKEKELNEYKKSKQASYEALQKQCNELELENRKLKKSLDEKNKFLEQLGISATGEFKRIKYYIDKLVAEKKELEKELRQKKATILMNNDHYFEVDKTNRKLKQTLTEIKEIVSSTLDCGEWVGQGDNKMEQILNKISEVSDDNR